jgi:uncharacterized membrane protein (UPF0127 family)
MILSILCLALLGAGPATGKTAVQPSEARPYVKIGKTAFQVEVVRTPSEWQKGLMFREHLGPREGMFFLGTREYPQAFWMKNTLVPLDIIFISKDLKIVSIQKNAKPLSEENLPSGKPAMHVLEILGGTSDALHFSAGNKVELHGVLGVRP